MVACIGRVIWLLVESDFTCNVDSSVDCFWVKETCIDGDQVLFKNELTIVLDMVNSELREIPGFFEDVLLWAKTVFAIICVMFILVLEFSIDEMRGVESRVVTNALRLGVFAIVPFEITI